MSDRSRTRSSDPGPDAAEAKTNAARDANGPEQSTHGLDEAADAEAIERSLDERIEEALGSLSEVLEQADPFGDLAAAVDAARDDEAGDDDDGSFETVDEADETTSLPREEASEQDDGEFEAVDEAEPTSEEPADIDEAAEGEAEIAEAAGEVVADAEAGPDPEESIETIESLLGEVEATLGVGEVSAEGLAADDAESEAPGVDEMVPEDAELEPPDASDADLADGLPEPSLEAELAHDESLAAAYDENLGSDDDSDLTAEIAGDLEALKEAEGTGGLSGTANGEDDAVDSAFQPADALADELAATIDPVAEVEEMSGAAADSEPDDRAGSDADDTAESMPVTGKSTERDDPVADVPTKSSAAEAGKAGKAMKEPLLVRMRPRVMAGVHRVCTVMSGPMTLVPVSMRDPLGAIAAFTLVNALLVWVLVLVLR